MTGVQRPIAELDGALSCALPGAARVLFTTRAQGNLSTQRGEGHEQGRARRDRLCEQLGLSWLCAGRQVHGSVVHLLRSRHGAGGAPVPLDADGHATALPNIGAMVLSADCLPVALTRDGAVAMLHAGWRGLAAGVLEEGLRALGRLAPGAGDEDEQGPRGEPIVAAIGPAAGLCCYEVGREVHAAFGGAHREGRRIDLRALARDRLLAAGVEQVLDARACTICDERFFSHRREGARAGRQAGVAWLS